MDRASRVVIALGGNALQEAGAPPTAEAQLEVVRKTAGFLAEISTKGYEMAIVHGNGPQVGRIVLSQEIASRENPQTPAMPFDVCGAMSQGYIGYHIQQALREALKDRGRDIPVVTLVTQVVVDPGDPAFSNPTKPIGPFYTEGEAKAIANVGALNASRRVVPSPDPKRIVELSAVKRLWDTSIVITAGGGGIPVVEKGDGSLAGVAAVIDKDLAAGRLAQDIEADILLILTEVDKVCLNYKKPGQRFLDGMTAAEAERFMEEGHFAPGSMLPKVLASVKFARSSPGRKAVITSLFKAVEALEGREGTVVTMD